MSYIDNIFERANIQKLVSFLVYGTEIDTTGSKTYKERLDEVGSDVMNAIKVHIPDGDLRSDFERIVLGSWGEYERVFLEIGLLAEIRLASEFSNRISDK